MNLAAAMVAMSLFGIQQDVLKGANGKPEEYVIRLAPTEIDTLREGRRTLDSAIARLDRGGKLYRIYVDEQPNRQAIENPNPQNIDVQLKPSSITGESVFSIALSEQQLRDLENGEVFGGILPTNPRSAGVRFEIVPFAAAGVAPEEDRFPERDAAPRSNEVRNPGYRSDLERNRYASRDRDPAGLPSGGIDNRYADDMRRRAEQYRTIGDTLPEMQPTSILEEIRRKALQRNVSASSDPLNNFPREQSGRLEPGAFDEDLRSARTKPLDGSKLQQRFLPNSGATISENRKRAPNASDEEVSFQQSPGGSFPSNQLPQQQQTSDPRFPLAVLLGLLSLGANFFLGYQVFSWYMRYRDVIDQVRMGNSWSNDSRSPTI